MPWTPAQLRLFGADAAGHGRRGPSPAVAKRILSEHAGVRRDVDKTGHAKPKKRPLKQRSLIHSAMGGH